MSESRDPSGLPVRPTSPGLPVRPIPPGSLGHRRMPSGLGGLPQVSVEGWPGAQAHLQSFEVVEEVNAPACCNLTLQDPGILGSGQTSTASPLEFGQPIAITRPDAGGAVVSLFKGRVFGLGSRQEPGAPPVLDARGFDRLQELAMARRSRSFEQSSVADVLRRTAIDHGMGADISLGGPRHGTLAQVNQSDLAFLRSLARECDAEFWVEEGTLYARTRLERPGHEVSLGVGAGMHRWQAFADLQPQRQALVVSRWDVPAKAGASHVGGVPVLAGEAGGLTAASALLQELGIPRVAPDERIVHLGASSAEAGSESAGARFAALARGFVTVVATVDGDPRIRVGTRAHLSGMGIRFDGRYRVVAARHVMDMQEGYRTEFEANRMGVGT